MQKTHLHFYIGNFLANVHSPEFITWTWFAWLLETWIKKLFVAISLYLGTFEFSVSFPACICERTGSMHTQINSASYTHTPYSARALTPDGKVAGSGCTKPFESRVLAQQSIHNIIIIIINYRFICALYNVYDGVICNNHDSKKALAM